MFVESTRQTCDGTRVDMARFLLFPKAGTPDKVPPTSDALRYHIMKTLYYAMIWRQAHCPKQILPKPDESDWKLMSDKLVPILMTLDPIPKACLEIITCNCNTGCATLRCKRQENKYSMFWTLWLWQLRE